MPLTNTQYDAVMRHYDALQEQNRYDQSARMEEVYLHVPEMAGLDDELASRSMEAARARIADPGADLSAYRQAMKEISERRRRLLIRSGYPEDYLDLHFHCPLCHDTGFVDGQRCSCFERIAADMLYGSISLRDELSRENFAHFSFDYYSDTIVDSTTGLTPLASAKRAYAAAREVAGTAGTGSANLFLYGNTGTGKTFLSHCITEEALRNGCYVLYFSAPELFDVLGGAFRGRDAGGGASLYRNSSRDTARAMIREAGLLVIDDLGTELVNAFTSSELFRIINERLESRRSTVISSNLSIEHLREKYSERVFSRIISNYKVVALTGEDIRIRKKFL